MDLRHKYILRDKYNVIAETVSFDDLVPLLKEYKIFNRYMWEDINSLSDLFNALPSRGPKAFQNLIKILRRAKYDKEADTLENATSSNIHADKELFYEMSSKPLGLCLIINNIQYYKENEVRIGSDVDAQSLSEFFMKIGYDVKIEPDMEGDKMFSYLSAFSQSNFKFVDSAIVIILSHGGRINNLDVIYGIDDVPVYKNNIINLFNNKNCQQLQEKPKILFFVACRGTRHDYGAQLHKPSESVDSMNVSHDLLPCLTDVFVINSTLPENVSVRDHNFGSWFCQDLISVLNEHYKVHDLETIIKFLNQKLIGRISETFRTVQVAHFEHFGGLKKINLCGTSSD